MSASATTTTTMTSTVLYPTAAASSSASASDASSVGGSSPIEIDAAIPPPSTKKHAAGHIPRPRNAFILFRSDYARKQQLSSALTNVERENQNDLSRSVGRVWRAMSDAERAPWHVMAEEEKKRHAAQYPGYKYAPRARKLATPGPATILPPTMPSGMAPAAGSTVFTGPIRTPIYYSHSAAPSVRIKPYTPSQVRSSLPGHMDDTDSDSDEEMIAPALSKACWNAEEEEDEDSRTTSKLQPDSSFASTSSSDAPPSASTSSTTSSSPSPATPTPRTPPDRTMPLPLSYDPKMHEYIPESSERSTAQ
uniref:HMG box domain-containing protein n=1 Tax=Mycena chlorophos TaxID=658473 RepID=A0ABQ0LGG7_MYCCL|nr:predicted protein [Mycena chlorophos]